MDLFRDISKGKYGNNKELKKESKHELAELGGEKRAEKFEKCVKGKGPCSCKGCRISKAKNKVLSKK